MVGHLPANEKTITIGYDSSQPDSQMVANLMSPSWPRRADGQGAGLPDVADLRLGRPTTARAHPTCWLDAGWPDAAVAVHVGAHQLRPDGGLNYLSCSAPRRPRRSARASDGQRAGLLHGQPSSRGTGCWLNLANVNDFMVAQPWLKGVEAAHVVSNPNTARLLDKLSAADGKRRRGPQDHPAHARLGGAAEVGLGVRGAVGRAACASRCPACCCRPTAGGCCSTPGSTPRCPRPGAAHAGSSRASGTGRCCPGPVSRSRRRWPRSASTSTTSTPSRVSHLHHDHAGGLKLFAGRVPVHVQRRELDVRPVATPGARAPRDLPGRLRRPAHRLARRRRRGRDRARGHGGAHRRAHARATRVSWSSLDESWAAAGSSSPSTRPTSPRTSSTSCRSAGSSTSTAGDGRADPAPEELATEKGFTLVPGHDPHVWPELTETLRARFG